MRRILQFLSRYGNLLLFFLLEGISLLLIIRLNNPHRDVSNGFFLQVSASVSNVTSDISSYFNLNAENNKLANENQRLHAELIKLKQELETYKYRVPLKKDYTVLPDSLFPAGGFNFIPCRAINNSVNNNYNFITLNRGRNQGVRKGMGLISPEGIAGKVIDVSSDFSLALSVLNKKFKLSSKLMGTKNIGTISWNGSSPEFAILDYIPQTSEVQKGDSVVTSAYGTYFPEGFFVGTVHSFSTLKQDGFYEIVVDLATNFRALGNLYLVEHEMKDQIDSLEIQTIIQ